MLTMAIPNKGVLLKPTLDLLGRAGFTPREFSDRKLCVETDFGEMKFLLMRTEEVGGYGESGVADLGITGQDLIAEKGCDVDELLELNYGKCKLVLAGQEGAQLENGARIATKFGNLAGEYLEGKGIEAEVIDSQGSTEIKPLLGLADFIIDISSTGSTLSKNGLVVYDTIYESQAALVANRKALAEKEAAVNEVIVAVQSVLLAENKSYIMFNISKATLENIMDKIPCMRSPTVVPTGDEEIVSVQTVVPTDDVSRTINRLKGYGTTDILVMDIQRVVI